MSIVGAAEEREVGQRLWKRTLYDLDCIKNPLKWGRESAKKKLVTSFMNTPLTELSMENNEVKPHDLAVPLSSKTHKTTM